MGTRTTPRKRVEQRPQLRSSSPSFGRRGFTLIELIVAGIIAIIVIGALTLSMTQLARSRSATQKRLEAHLRAAAALDAVRRDIASTLRSDDLFQTRFLILDKTQSSRIGDIPRDELLVFSSRLSAVRPNKYQGEGEEYETQFRVADDELGAALWQRRDPVPDRTPDGGGVVTPVVDGVVALNLEDSAGETWYPDWDSDIYGLPWAVRATVTTVGQTDGEDPYGDLRNVVSLRATVALDRIVPPKTEEEAAEDKAQTAADEAEEALNNGGVLPGEVPDGGPRPGGDRPGSGGPGPGGPGGGGPGGGVGGGGVGGGGGGQVGGGGMGGRGGGSNGFGSRGSRGSAARTRGGQSGPGGGVN